MMRRHNPQVKEDGFYALLPHASEFAAELINEFRTERAHGLRCRLLELIGEARSRFELLVENLWGKDECLRTWAVRELENLGDKRSRTALWDAQTQTFDDPTETDRFRQELRVALERLRFAR
jgi:hypothetical protein